MAVRRGDILIIEDERFDVLASETDIDRCDTERKRCVGVHERVLLHRIGDPALDHTHVLKLYHDAGKAVLCREHYEELPAWLEHPRQRMYRVHNDVVKTIAIKRLKAEPAKEE